MRSSKEPDTGQTGKDIRTSHKGITSVGKAIKQIEVTIYARKMGTEHKRRAAPYDRIGPHFVLASPDAPKATGQRKNSLKTCGM